MLLDVVPTVGRTPSDAIRAADRPACVSPRRGGSRIRRESTAGSTGTRLAELARALECAPALVDLIAALGMRNATFFVNRPAPGFVAIESAGVVRSLSPRDHQQLVSESCDFDLVVDLAGRPLRIRHRAGPMFRRFGSAQDVRVLGALALSERPLCPDELPTAVAQPSKVVERLRRRIGEPWIATVGRGEGKSYAFTIPPGKTAVIIVTPAMSVDFNRLPWFGTT